MLARIYGVTFFFFSQDIWNNYGTRYYNQKSVDSVDANYSFDNEYYNGGPPNRKTKGTLTENVSIILKIENLNLLLLILFLNHHTFSNMKFRNNKINLLFALHSFIFA